MYISITLVSLATVVSHKIVVEIGTNDMGSVLWNNFPISLEGCNLSYSAFKIGEDGYSINSTYFSQSSIRKMQEREI